MSNASIVFQQMLMLFAMIGIGIWLYKKEWVSETSAGAINKIVVNICNPLMMFSTVINPENRQSGAVIFQNFEMAMVFYVVLFLLSVPTAKILGKTKDDQHKFQMMTIFSNIGFMAIPLVRALMGNEAVFLTVFYGVTFNVIVYTYGIYLARPTGQEKSGATAWESIKPIVTNIGFIASVLAILLFLWNPVVPSAIDTFVDYFGNATIPFSMLCIGFSLAKLPMKELLGSKRIYAFTLLKMVVIPFIIVTVLNLLPITLDPSVRTVFLIEISMPVASMCTMIVREYGEDKGLVSSTTAITTLVGLVTIPLILWYAG